VMKQTNSVHTHTVHTLPSEEGTTTGRKLQRVENDNTLPNTLPENYNTLPVVIFALV